jgi:phage terminase large subunit-like protein
VQLVGVKGDKLARALAVQPMFSQGMIYAPDRDWAELVITEMSMFPMGRHDDLTDSSSMALKYLRDVGLAESDEEVSASETENVRPRPRLRALYPC